MARVPLPPRDPSKFSGIWLAVSDFRVIAWGNTYSECRQRVEAENGSIKNVPGLAFTDGDMIGLPTLGKGFAMSSFLLTKCPVCGAVHNLSYSGSVPKAPIIYDCPTCGAFFDAWAYAVERDESDE